MRSIFSAILLGMLFALDLGAEAAEWSSKEAGVCLQLPTDPEWTQIKADMEGLARVIFQRQDKMALVQFTFFANYPAAQKLDETYVQLWEKRHYSNHDDKKVSGEFTTFKGRRAYRVCDQPKIEGQKCRSITMLWLSDDGRLCSIFATRYQGDPLEDPVIKSFVNSLTFLPGTSK